MISRGNMRERSFAADCLRQVWRAQADAMRRWQLSVRGVPEGTTAGGAGASLACDRPGGGSAVASGERTGEGRARIQSLRSRVAAPL